VAVSTAAGSLFVVVGFPSLGWGTLIFGIPYLVICGIHVVLHWRLATRVERRIRVASMTFIASDVLLLGVFLLQEGYGDSSTWLAITALVGGGPNGDAAAVPAWFPNFFDKLLFVTVFVSWVAVVAVSRRHRHTWHSIVVSATVVGCVLTWGLLGAVVGAVGAKHQAIESAFAALGGPPPTNCSTEPVPTMAPSIGSFGQPPVWLYRMDGLVIEDGLPVVHLGTFHGHRQVNYVSRGPNSYEVTAGWIMLPSLTQPAHVQVTAQGSRDAMLIMNSEGPRGAVRDVQRGGVLDPAGRELISPKDAPPHRYFSTKLTLQGWGCYDMSVDWPGGSWRVSFGVGE
jgi:hypothetical protein